MEIQQGQFYLFSKRRFLPFFITQFLGALNDNLFKNALLVIVVTTAVANADSKTDFTTNIAAGLFILPFFLFSTLAGHLADKYDKAFIIRRIKFAEVILMLAGCFALWRGDINLMLAILFLLGVQSAFFGPIKYAIIPQHLATGELVAGNAQVGMGTFVSILLGTLVGGWLVTGPQGPIMVGALTISMALCGWYSSCKIPDAPPEKMAETPSGLFNPLRETVQNFRLAKQNPIVLTCIMAASWFWFYGSCFLTQVPNFAVTILQGHPTLISILLGAFIIGVAMGSLLCHRLSNGKVEPGLVPLATLGLSLVSLDLYFSSTAYVFSNQLSQPLAPMAFLMMPEGLRVLAGILFIGLFGGLFIVPLYSMIQQGTKAESRARVLSVNNICNALFMVISSLIGILLLSILGWSIPQFFLAIALLNLLFMGTVFYYQPIFISAFKGWIKILRVRKS
jgi:MFS family permease